MPNHSFKQAPHQFLVVQESLQLEVGSLLVLLITISIPLLVLLKDLGTTMEQLRNLKLIKRLEVMFLAVILMKQEIKWKIQGKYCFESFHKF